ncbi:hypothetical protein DFH09DRAFT_1439674 [Mycena vulgaris]|nr:hypothetical protein DFH09DRAFT_1439674 [Mycena vulgaris]
MDMIAAERHLDERHKHDLGGGVMRNEPPASSGVRKEHDAGAAVLWEQRSLEEPRRRANSRERRMNGCCTISAENRPKKVYGGPVPLAGGRDGERGGTKELWRQQHGSGLRKSPFAHAASPLPMLSVRPPRRIIPVAQRQNGGGPTPADRMVRHDSRGGIERCAKPFRYVMSALDAQE